MLSTMNHTKDTTRSFGAHRGDTSEDVKELQLLPAPPAVHSSSAHDETPPQSKKPAATSRFLTHDETITLARRKVENGLQETRRSLAGSEAVDDVVRPKLTIDLGHSNIDRIPEAVVDIIKDEVARLDSLQCKTMKRNSIETVVTFHLITGDVMLISTDYPCLITISIIFPMDS